MSVESSKKKECIECLQVHDIYFVPLTDVLVIKGWYENCSFHLRSYWNEPTCDLSIDEIPLKERNSQQLQENEIVDMTKRFFDNAVYPAIKEFGSKIFKLLRRNGHPITADMLYAKLSTGTLNISCSYILRFNTYHALEPIMLSEQVNTKFSTERPNIVPPTLNKVSDFTISRIDTKKGTFNTPFKAPKLLP